MEQIKLDSGKWLEMGTGVFALSLLVGAALFIVGRSLDKRQSRLQKSKGPASPGAVPSERHQNIQTVAAR